MRGIESENNSVRMIYCVSFVGNACFGWDNVGDGQGGLDDPSSEAQARMLSLRLTSCARHRMFTLFLPRVVRIIVYKLQRLRLRRSVCLGEYEIRVSIFGLSATEVQDDACAQDRVHDTLGAVR